MPIYSAMILTTLLSYSLPWRCLLMGSLRNISPTLMRPVSNKVCFCIPSLYESMILLVVDEYLTWKPCWFSVSQYKRRLSGYPSFLCCPETCLVTRLCSSLISIWYIILFYFKLVIYMYSIFDWYITSYVDISSLYNHRYKYKCKCKCKCRYNHNHKGYIYI